jgi:DNA-binding response OmpR family regulator
MRRILIALKDQGVSKRLDEMLEPSGYKLYLAGSFEEAAELYKAEAHDLVIAELDIPGSGGDKLCIHIKKSFPEHNTFVILACGATAAELRKCGKSGADSYVKTPIEPDDIVRRVNAILQKDTWRAPRVLVKVRVATSFKSEEFFCTSHNLSVTGIFIETDKSLARDDIIHCSFYLLDMDRIRADCKVVRVGKAKNGMHAYGVEFVSLDGTQKEVLEEFIAKQRETGNIV